MGENAGSTRGADWTRMTRVESGSIARYSWSSPVRASSANAPASSTPVGPPPTTTKVSQASRLVGSSSLSACSNARSMRLRIAVASSMLFSPGACAAHSSRPK